MKKLSVFIPVIVLSYIVFFIVSSDYVNAGFDCWWSGKEDCGPNNKCTVVGEGVFFGKVYSCEYCKPGFGDCDMTGGCKISFLNDPDNCGGCGFKCVSNQFCYLGECESLPEEDILICGGRKCGPDDICSPVVPCKRRVGVSCIDVDVDGEEECNYNLITDDACIELCESGECDNGNCVETKPTVECYEDYIGEDCITSDCYSGKIIRECNDGIFGEYYCKATSPNVFQCNTDEECVNGECVKKTECEHGDVKYGQECVTTDCYNGKWKITCRADGTWDTGECVPSLDYRCDSKQKCVDGECVDKKEDNGTSPADSEDKPGGFLGKLFLIIFILVVLGVGGYVAYSYYFSKSKPKEPIKPSFTPTYVPRRPVLRKSLQKAKVRDIVKKRRKAKRTKREKFLKPFDEESKEKIPKKTKK